MAGIPAYCSHCGTILKSRAFRFDGPVYGTTFSGNQETCINCKKMANIIDGTFDVSGDVVSLISGPALSRTILEQFAALVDKTAKQELSTEELKTEAEKLDPVLGAVVSQVTAKNFGIAALIILVLFIKSCNFKVDATVDINKLYDQWTGHGTKTEYVIPSMHANTEHTSEHKGSSHANPPGHGPSKK
jgi:hypothetical protein